MPTAAIEEVSLGEVGGLGPEHMLESGRFCSSIWFGGVRIGSGAGEEKSANQKKSHALAEDGWGHCSGRHAIVNANRGPPLLRVPSSDKLKSV